MQRSRIVLLAALVAAVALLALVLWPRGSAQVAHTALPPLAADAAGGAGGAANAPARSQNGDELLVVDASTGQPVRSARELGLPAADRLRPDNQPAADRSGPLLSLPLRGGVDPDTGAAPTKSTGLVVNGGDVEFTEDAELTVPAGGHVNGRAGSIVLEIQPNWSGAEETANSLLQIRNQEGNANALQIVKERNALRFIIRDDQGLETSINAYIDHWQANETHRVTVTWGEALMKLYLDGVMVGENTVSNSLRWQDTTPIHIGSDFPGAAFAGANGKIRELQIYGRTLDPDEIRLR